MNKHVDIGSLFVIIITLILFIIALFTKAVKYRGYWFSIDDTDMKTKLFYKIVRSLWSVSIAASTDQRAAPVLTLPVSR